MSSLGFRAQRLQRLIFLRTRSGSCVFAPAIRRTLGAGLEGQSHITDLVLGARPASCDLEYVSL